MTVITTSTASTATAYSNQRKIDRTSNGMLWAVHASATATDGWYTFTYSTDNGITWVNPGTSSAFGWGGYAYVPNVSFFIDVDDYAHVAYKDPSNGYIYYRRGTPNAARTAWTWSAATTVWSASTAGDYPDVVAHREGTGWAAHIVFSVNTSGADRTRYCRVDITSAGAVSTAAGPQWTSYGNTVHKYPSIDFNHTGDGKTVAGGTPHLYVAWSAGASGAGKGIRFIKATYSAGTWTWGTEREIDSTRYISTDFQWLNCLFDGTRVVIGGEVTDGTNLDLVLYERDGADTTTTVRVLLDNSVAADRLLRGSLSYDAIGDVYIIGRDNAATSYLNYRKWTRATNSLSAFVTMDAGLPPTLYASMKRGYSNSRIEFIYTDGTASPYSVTFDKIVLNTLPVATLADTVKIDPRINNTFSWTYSDAEGSLQTAFEFDYRVSGGTWANYSTGTTATNVTIPANTLADETDYEVRVRVSDGTDWGNYSTDTFRSDSWTTLTEVPSSAASGNIDTTGFLVNEEYEIQVRTADAVGYGPWSTSAISFITNVMAYVGGTWKASRKQFRHWSEGWKDQGTTKF